jgi:CRISPR-associated protein Csy1
MNQITSEQVIQAIDGWLSDVKQKKLEPELKKLAKAEEKSDYDAQQVIRQKMSDIDARYQRESWIKSEAVRLAGQLKFGTHISKGVHPDSKGDNINFSQGRELPANLVGSQSVDVQELDANGNAAALPFAAFLNIEVGEFSRAKLGNLISENHAALKNVFASDEELSKDLLLVFKAAIEGSGREASTDERNKQVLWPTSGSAIDEDCYVNLIPLFPSVLTHNFFQKLNQLRFADEIKIAKENRKKKNAEQFPYLAIPSIAIFNIGGSNAQNAGSLSAKRKGKNLLLPSLPPQFQQISEFRIGAGWSTIFGRELSFRCQEGFRELYSVIEGEKNTIDVRDQRRYALDLIVATVLEVAMIIQRQYPDGWSRDYDLDMDEKLWLDPGRADIEDERPFADQRDSSKWIDAIERRFALWVNERLKSRFSNIRADFADPQHHEWSREFRDAIKVSLRSGQEVFA